MSLRQKAVVRFLAASLALLISHPASAQNRAGSPLPDAGFGMGPPVSSEIVAAAAAAASPTVAGPYQPTWDSIKSNYRVPKWFIDAKFGITMHWGLYSIPAHHNEWYEKHMYGDRNISQWHAAHFGAQDKFGYKDFIPLFTASKFDAADLAQLVAQSGAKYFMPTCEHHDGYSLWDTAFNPWNSAKTGPKRDLIGEMALAARNAGLKFGVCNHSIEHYTFIQPIATLATDLADPGYTDFYWTQHDDARLQKFLELWVAKNMELIDKYKIDVLWFDNGANARAYDPLKLKVAAYYYNRAIEWQKEVTIDTKDSCYLAGSVLDFEKPLRGPRTILNGVWEVEDPIGSTWGYTADETFRGPQPLITELCDTAAKNGNLLLNLSPSADGSINAPQRESLLEIGHWLSINGDAIYGTHNWTTYIENGPVNWRFTVNGDDLYAIAQAWPGPQAVIHSLAAGKTAGAIQSVSLLGSSSKLSFTQDAGGLTVQFPPDQPCKYAFALKITGLKLNPAGPPIGAVLPTRRGG